MTMSKIDHSFLKSENINDQIENHSHELLLNGRYTELLKMKSICDKMHYPDTTNALILKYLFIAMKKSNDVDMKFLHRNLIMNTERNNYESVSVLVNSILKVMISKKLFKEAMVYIKYVNINQNECNDDNKNIFLENNFINNQFLENDYFYFYQSGVVLMFCGKYEAALKNFRRSMIIKATLRTMKYERLCLMLNNQFENVSGFEKFFEKYGFRNTNLISKPECSLLDCFEDKIFAFLKFNEKEINQCRHLVKRLYINLQLVIAKKISKVYLAVPIFEISHLLGLNEKEAVNLFSGMIGNNEIKGKVENGIFYSKEYSDYRMSMCIVDNEKLLNEIIKKNLGKKKELSFCVENCLDENGHVKV
ncbi:26S proteasome regulatory subunit RPN3 [Dictyocoela muelleri]|nr:26S proteasome regulatory subunit RPN3 [Dictyocoela muelleri]